MKILKTKNGQAIAPPTVKMDNSAFAPSDETLKNVRILAAGEKHTLKRRKQKCSPTTQ